MAPGLGRVEPVLLLLALAGEVSAACEPEPSKSFTAGLPFWAIILIVCILVIASALFSGLRVLLLSMDINVLQIYQRGGHEELASRASRIASIRGDDNTLHVTLLLGNVIANLLCALVLAEIMNSAIAFGVSTTLVVLLGEILPVSVCTRRELHVGSKAVPIAKVLIGLFYVLAKPIAIFMDCFLGSEVANVHTRQELIEMVKLQMALGAGTTAEGLAASQVAEGAFRFRDKNVGDIMKPVDDTYMLKVDATLGYDTIRDIFEKGFSRVPVYGKDPHDIVGLLYAKDLMLVDPEDEMKLGDFIRVFGRKVESFFKTTKLPEVLNRFKKGGTHMGLVRESNFADASDPKVNVIGLLTLEDIVEEILQEEIVDETDYLAHGDEEKASQLNLGIFNPNWSECHRAHGRLSENEMNAIAAHLERSLFVQGCSMELSFDAVRWLVAGCEVQECTRQTPLGSTSPVQADYLCRAGFATSRCFLVLQGRVCARLGRDAYHCEAGAFCVLARDALRPSSKPYTPDFSAFLSTPKVRLMIITRDTYFRARELDKDKSLLDEALEQVLAEYRGELKSNTRDAMPLSKGLPEPDPPDPGSPGFSPLRSSTSHRQASASLTYTAEELGVGAMCGNRTRLSQFPDRMSV